MVAVLRGTREGRPANQHKAAQRCLDDGGARPSPRHRLNNTGHHAVCELLCDENSTIHESLVDIGEETPPPVAAPSSLVDLAKAIEECLHEGLSPLAVLNHCNKTVLLG